MCSLLRTQHSRFANYLVHKAKIWEVFGKRTPEIDPAVLQCLVCPETKAPLRWDSKIKKLVTESHGTDGRAYNIENGVLKLLPKKPVKKPT